MAKPVDGTRRDFFREIFKGDPFAASGSITPVRLASASFVILDENSPASRCPPRGAWCVRRDPAANSECGEVACALYGPCGGLSEAAWSGRSSRICLLLRAKMG
jgi:hypothetical protein